MEAGNEELHAASSRPQALTPSVVDVGSHSGCLEGAGNNATATVTDGIPFGGFGGIHFSSLYSSAP
jgi:hypothetical protein